MFTDIQEKFYNLFWKSEDCQQLFLMHKEQLLQKEEIEIGNRTHAFYLSRFVLSNSFKQPNSLPRIEQRLDNRNIDLKKSLQVKTEKNFPEEKIAQYFNEKLAKPFELVSQKLSGNRISQIRFISEVVTSLSSEKRLMRLLHKYELVSKEIKSLKELANWIENFVEKQLREIIKPDHFTDVLTAVDEIASHYSNFHYNSLLEAYEFHTNTILNNENYIELLPMLDDLYECGALIGGVNKTYFECTHCEMNVFSGSMTLKVNPKKLKLKCPNCGKDAFYLAPYKLHDDIFKDIISKDGLLAEAICSLLKESRLDYTKNSTIGSDIEIDIAIRNKAGVLTDIVEVKTFRTDKTQDVLLANSSTNLKKFISAFDRLVEYGGIYRSLRCHFISNLNDEELNRQLRLSFKEELGSRPITIHSLETFQTMVETISQKEFRLYY